MLPRCGRVAHICEANRTVEWNCNKNLRENRKNRNCLQNQKDVMRYKVSGAIAIPKASWGCAPALPNRIRVISLGAMFHVKHYMTWKQHRNWVAIYEPQANESFSMQQFFKNAAEVWASSPHLRSKSNCTTKLQQKSKRKSEESQLSFKSKGCNEIQGFRGNCDSLGKLGMCPSLAEPNLSGFPRSNVSRETWHESNIEIGLQYTSRRQMKVFWSNIFLKMLARFRASSPDRCPQAAKSPCHPFGTRRGWWEKRQLFEAGRTRPPRLVSLKQ